MANGWKKWDKIRCVVEVKVPPGSPTKAKDLIYQVEQALLGTYGPDKNIPLPRSSPMRHLRSKFRVLHFGKVIQGDKVRRSYEEPV